MDPRLPPEQLAIRRETDRAERQLARALEEELRKALETADLTRFEQVIRERYGLLSPNEISIFLGLAAAFGAFGGRARDILTRALERALARGTPIFARTFTLLPGWTSAAFRRYAAAWASERSARLVRGLVEGYVSPQGVAVPGQAETLRRILSEGFRRGRSAKSLAADIADLVGLDERRALAMEKFRKATLARTDLSKAQARRLIEKELRKKKLSRALAIGQTEALSAATAAQHILWDQAILAGSLDARKYRKRWFTAPGACPICQPLEGATAPINGRFPEPGGFGPPVHPRCVCGIGLQLVP